MQLTPEQLGSEAFRQRYGVRYAYTAGAMYKGIASPELVIKMGQAGLIGYLGTGGLKLPVIAEAIDTIQNALKPNQAYGMNLLCHLDQPNLEMSQVALFLEKGVRFVEAAAFMQMTPALVRYRLSGLQQTQSGQIECRHRIIAKVSRPEVAAAFMQPAPTKLVQGLLAQGLITEEQARLSQSIPIAHEVCVEADSGGHTDQGVAYVLTPTIKRLSQDLTKQYDYAEPILVGAAGGIGTPEAAAAAFLLGADFIVTGSINQCTVEAGTSDRVKELLSVANIQDMAYAPAGDMFEIGAKVQVLKRGLFFSARANKLYELYQRLNSLDELDEKTAKQIQDNYFKRSFEAVWQETKAYYLKTQPEVAHKAEHNPKYKMLLIYKWYFIHTTRLAMGGSDAQKVDYQIHCGPALGAFNQWVKGTPLENWRERHVDAIAEKLMTEAARYQGEYVAQLAGVALRSEANVAAVF